DKEPEYIENWLLDVQLANGEFRTDQSAIWLSELDLPNEFIDIVEQHPVFFDTSKAKVQTEKRKQKLKSLLNADDTLSVVRLKMLAVCANSDARIDNILENLLSELSAKKETAINLISRCQLTDFLWHQIERHYAYQSDSPSIKDFSIELFKSCYSMGLDSPLNKEEVKLGGDALVFFKRWKDSRMHQQSFEILSNDCADLLGIESDLNQRDIKELIEIDYFELVDRKVIVDLVNIVEERTASPGDITLWCRQRRQGYWFDEFKHLYNAVDVASQFMALLETVQFSMPTPTEAVQSYTRLWYKLDQLYRQYVFALKVSGQTSLLNSLSEKIENLYINRYVLPLSNAWQQHVDAMNEWSVNDVTPQNFFYKKWVKPYLDNNKKIYVIISDAFRYEAGDEMVSRIRQEDRYQAQLDAALSSLPSYTQLGMASLLPQSADMSLQIADNKTATVFMGEQSTQGTENRDKVLKALIGERATAVQTKVLMDMTREESRELLKDHDVIYFYHNRIDHTGDKMQSEGEAFEATDKTFDDLMRVIKKLTSANATNLVVTADHGFIYQNRALDESDFLSKDVSGDVLYNDRRFLLGKSLTSSDGLKDFSAEQLGVAGDVGAVIPKGIQRLRLSGSGSRFVHGGASLQETVIPVITINKKRQSDTGFVGVDILRSGSNVISSGLLTVTLYQSEPMTDKVQSRQFRVGIYTEDNVLISNQHDIPMDLTSDNPREREMKLKLVLSKQADEANGKEVVLKLEEPVSDTNQYTEYKSLRYTIRRSFTSDFDF
ncbi:MAG: BREX-1 system phosphatase PglZ type A, partial [Gammaproteobacteria bacterium]|nr:BREX-1 system phosphatase PglZ type A [Gammaproteobacteria bacterium]